MVSLPRDSDAFRELDVLIIDRQAFVRYTEDVREMLFFSSIYSPYCILLANISS